MPGSSLLATAFSSVAVRKASSCSGRTSISTWTSRRLFDTSRPYYPEAPHSQPAMTQVRGDFVGGGGTVCRLEASQECVAEPVFLGSDHLDRIARNQRAELGAALQRQLPGDPSKKSCAVRVTNPGRVDSGDFTRNRYVLSRLTRDLDTGPVGASGDHTDSDPLHDVLMRPACLLRDEAVLVVVGEQVRRAVDQLFDLRAVHPGHLLGGIGDEVESPDAALVGVPQHCLRIVRRADDLIEAPRPFRNWLQLDLARLRHCTGVE